MKDFLTFIFDRDIELKITTEHEHIKIRMRKEFAHPDGVSGSVHLAHIVNISTDIPEEELTKMMWMMYGAIVDKFNKDYGQK